MKIGGFRSRIIYPYDHAVGMPEDGYFDWPGKGSVGSRWDRDYKRSLEFFGKNINRPWAGLYDHVKGKGLVHISNPRELRGIKIFSWGWCRDADMWSRILNDDMSKYVEMQSGLFETQGIYELLDVFDEKGWCETWFQIRDTKGYDAAGKNGILKLDNQEGKLAVRLLLTMTALEAELCVKQDGYEIFRRKLEAACNTAMH